MSMQTFVQEGGPCTTLEICCPFLDELLYHRHPGRLTCMATSFDCQQPKAGGAVNDISKLHNQLLPALIFSVTTVPAVPAASLHPSCQLTSPADSPSVSCRKGTTTSVHEIRMDRTNEHVKCLLLSREKGFNHSLLHRTSWLPSQQPFGSPSQTHTGWVSLTGGV